MEHENIVDLEEEEGINMVDIEEEQQEAEEQEAEQQQAEQQPVQQIRDDDDDVIFCYESELGAARSPVPNWESIGEIDEVARGIKKEKINHYSMPAHAFVTNASEIPIASPPGSPARPTSPPFVQEQPYAQEIDFGSPSESPGSSPSAHSPSPPWVPQESSIPEPVPSCSSSQDAPAFSYLEAYELNHESRETIYRALLKKDVQIFATKKMWQRRVSLRADKEAFIIKGLLEENGNKIAMIKYLNSPVPQAVPQRLWTQQIENMVCLYLEKHLHQLNDAPGTAATETKQL